MSPKKEPPATLESFLGSVTRSEVKKAVRFGHCNPMFHSLEDFEEQSATGDDDEISDKNFNQVWATLCLFMAEMGARDDLDAAFDALKFLTWDREFLWLLNNRPQAALGWAFWTLFGIPDEEDFDDGHDEGEENGDEGG